jgi:disulfide bond formation protein DsbB
MPGTMPHADSDLLRSPASRVGVLVLVGAVVVILAALGFEHIGGYMPCPLCLQQRYAYYLAIPALLGAVALAGTRRPGAAAGLFLLVAVAFFVNSGLGTYQAGAEWKFWDPPASCAAPTTLPSFDLKHDNFNRIPVSCGVASWRFLGLSFAGWNAVASVLLAGGAAMAALKAVRGRPGG